MKTDQNERSKFSLANSGFVILSLVLSLAFSASASAASRYVGLNSANPAPPYTNWATAACVIQDAVDAAAPGDEIIVTNGLYATGGRAVGTSLLVNRVAVDKPLTLRSVNGPEVTVIRGYQVPGTTNGHAAIRCVYLASGASLSGFTLTNGATRVLYDGDGDETGGGGVSCEPGAQVLNCSLVGNSAGFGGGARDGILSNCVLIGNSSQGSGGGAWGSTLHICRLAGNLASAGGGAAWGELNNCTLSGNFAGYIGGGAVGSILNNCTLNYNSASVGGGGVAGGFLPAELNNCIIYFNSAPEDANCFNSLLNYCCTTPMPTNNGVGNITNAPMFVDYTGGNLRLQSNSPCINAGDNSYLTNLDFTNLFDLDGNPRVAGATVDIGAYEFQGGPGWQPRITSQPRSVAVLAGSNATFRVIGAGAVPLTYQWQLDGRDLLNATDATLTMSNLSLTDLGSYTVIVRNTWGEIRSQPAWLKLARWSELVVFDASISQSNWSNGKSWVEWFAERTCLSAPGQVKNYATGGATCSDVRSQITTYLRSYTPGANTLLAPWFAGVTSDLVWKYRPVAEVVSNYAANITQLAQAGGKIFILPNLEPIYLNPGLDSAYARSLDYQDINERLDREIQRIQADYGLTIFRFDFWGLCTNLYADPGAYGFTNVAGAARNYPSGDADKFLWWDGIHPTTALHRVISEATYRCLAPPLVLATAVRNVDGSWAIHWQGGAGPFRLQHGEDLPGDLWQSGELTFSTNQTVTGSPIRQFFRLLQLGQ